MAGGFDWASLLGQGISDTVHLGFGIYQNETNRQIARENMELQRETNVQNERLMREAWARDDTARQRMVKDLESAGLSKWLATGASPMTSSPISLTAPQNEYKADYGQTADALAHSYQNYMNLVQTDQTNKNLQKEGDILKWKEEEAQAEARRAKHDADVFDSRPDTASTDPAYMKYFAEIMKGLKGQSQAGQDVRNGLGWIDSKVNSAKQYFSPEAKAERKEKKELKKDEKYEQVHGYPRRAPMSFSDWCKTNQLEPNSSNGYRLSKIYQEYRDNFYKYAK